MAASSTSRPTRGAVGDDIARIVPRSSATHAIEAQPPREFAGGHRLTDVKPLSLRAAHLVEPAVEAGTLHSYRYDFEAEVSSPDAGRFDARFPRRFALLPLPHRNPA